MNIDRFFFAALLFTPLIAEAELVKFNCPREPNAPVRDIGKMQDISVFHLVGKPEAYDGKSVTVIGVLRTEATKAYLYPSIDSANHALTSLALVLRKPYCVDYKKWASLIKFSGSYVSVYGAYLSQGYGSVEAGAGEMTEISEIGTYN